MALVLETRSRSRSRSRSCGSAHQGASDDDADDDDDSNGVEQPVAVDEVLYEEQTPLQHVLVFRSFTFGICLSLDGVLQSTEADEHIYHEFLVHVPLALCSEPRRVLVCGGGPGGCAREALLHPSVQKVIIAEIDSTVVKVALRWFPWQSRALENPLVNVQFVDAADVVASNEMVPADLFDVIVVDGTDPGVTSGRSDHLWSTAFFANCLRCLAPGGVLSTQLGACLPTGGGLAWSDMAPIGVSRLRAAGFGGIAAYAAEVPSYGGLALFAVAREAASCPTDLTADDLRSRLAARGCSESEGLFSRMRAYSVEGHIRAFHLPAPLSLALEKNRDENDAASR